MNKIKNKIKNNIKSSVESIIVGAIFLLFIGLVIAVPFVLLTILPKWLAIPLIFIGISWLIGSSM